MNFSPPYIKSIIERDVHVRLFIQFMSFPRLGIGRKYKINTILSSRHSLMLPHRKGGRYTIARETRRPSSVRVVSIPTLFDSTILNKSSSFSCNPTSVSRFYMVTTLLVWVYFCLVGIFRLVCRN